MLGMRPKAGRSAAVLRNRSKNQVKKGSRRIFMENTLSSPHGRAAAYMNMLFVDHGFLRIPYYTRVALSPEMVRTNQPLPHHIKREAERGIKTIINLRGENRDGSYYLEKEACARYGVDLVNFRVKSRDVPAKEVLHGARDLFRSVKYPALMHCKSGADRVGFMSTLYLFLHRAEPLDKALAQFHWTYGHVRHGKTGILDFFFECYLQDAAVTGLDFFDWVDQVYDPDAMKQAFKTEAVGNFLVDKILRRE